MCWDCVHHYVSDGRVTMTDDMREVAILVDAIYSTPWGTTGGPLHIYLDDFNLDDHWFVEERPADIAESIQRRWDDQTVDADLVWRCWDLLRTLTEPERAVAVAMGSRMLPLHATGVIVTVQ